ncbi:hypothetical protein CLG96_02155 [Sphingomonas oleivorans]|uniref:Uncharacterized protein n=1 Tax=Sphingomonas oleivorans TaxID=1735121 RepID=A0A2T5G1E6_9SPHN|nr:hypothetical protein [Sphingomonas oleivorans]PTQ12968.1 hypothetical protein CLG96_02155 [Sphingomonas oleivorans]
MSPRDLAVLWAAAYGAALTAFAARVTWLLFGVAPAPPEDPAAYARWARKRRWLIISEFAALPMFATLAVLGAAQGWVSPVAAVLGALFGGALGFAFFVHALEAVVRRRIGLDEAKS